MKEKLKAYVTFIREATDRVEARINAGEYLLAEKRAGEIEDLAAELSCYIHDAQTGGEADGQS